TADHDAPKRVITMRRYAQPSAPQRREPGRGTRQRIKVARVQVHALFPDHRFAPSSVASFALDPAARLRLPPYLLETAHGPVSRQPGHIGHMPDLRSGARRTHLDRRHLLQPAL